LVTEVTQNLNYSFNVDIVQRSELVLVVVVIGSFKVDDSHAPASQSLAVPTDGERGADDRIPAPVVHLLAFGFQGCGRVS
jgi:hypothetical protein